MSPCLQLGVIALEPIPKGQIVCEYVGEVILRSEAKCREEIYLKNPNNPVSA